MKSGHPYIWATLPRAHNNSQIKKKGFKETNKCVKVIVKTAKENPENSKGEVN